MTQKTTVKGDRADKAQHQCAWDWDGANRAMAPPLEAAGAGSGGEGDTVGGRRRVAVESTHSSIVPDVMMVAAAPLRREGLPENPGGGGGLSLMAILRLSESNHLSGMEPGPQ